MKRWAQGAQPLVTAWLVVALVLPALLGFAPGAQANAVDQLLQRSSLQLCAQQTHAPDDDANTSKGHAHHDCPCCLPTAAGFAALVPLDAAAVAAPLWHQETAALVAFTRALIARQPHRLAPARAPPPAVQG
jgi:hypothetical protein